MWYEIIDAWNRVLDSEDTAPLDLAVSRLKAVEKGKPRPPTCPAPAQVQEAAVLKLRQRLSHLLSPEDYYIFPSNQDLFTIRQLPGFQELAYSAEEKAVIDSDQLGSLEFVMNPKMELFASISTLLGQQRRSKQSASQVPAGFQGEHNSALPAGMSSSQLTGHNSSTALDATAHANDSSAGELALPRNHQLHHILVVLT